MQKPVEKPIKFIKNLLTKGKSYPITHTEAVIDSNGKTLSDLLELMLSTIPSTSGDIMSYTDSEGNTRYIATSDNPSGINSSMTEVTWLELKNLRDNSQLIAGNLYRITDYNCTTTQENTQSAGHQFDIVLLALSENKLAEEGWAMMHDNIYDVTFDDGVTKKCYIYHTMDEYNDSIINVVDIETKLGLHCGYIEGDSGNLVTIDENAKTASTEEYDSIDLTEENLPYNYFQNSNLSAWKVWYCLDNDTNRFAWADDSKSAASIVMDGTTYNEMGARFIKNVGTFYEWRDGEDNSVLTENETPAIGDDIFTYSGSTRTDVGNVSAYIGGEIVGRGVIYRLIDEWNNDCPYDFKNVLYLRKLDGGSIDANGTDTYIPTFCLYDIGNDEYKDASIFAIEYVNDEGGINPCYNNSINSASAFNSPIDYTNKYCYALPCIIFLSSVESGSSSWATFDNKLISVYNSTFEGTCFTNIVFGSGTDYIDLCNSFVYGPTRASMESI